MCEFFGPGGCGILVNVLTDNANRARGDIHIVAKKQPIKAANSNAVACRFDLKARLDISTRIEEDKLMEICLEKSIDDFQLFSTVSDNPLSPQTEGHCSIFVDTKDMAKLRDALHSAGFEAVCYLQHVPSGSPVALSDEDFDAAMSAISALESLDDVDSVEHNIDMSSE